MPSLLKNVTEKVKEVTDAVHDSFFSNKEAPLAPLAVPGLPEGLPEVSEVPKVVEQSGVLFSDVSETLWLKALNTPTLPNLSPHAFAARQSCMGHLCNKYRTWLLTRC